METNCIYGYGFTVGSIGADSFKEFVKKHYTEDLKVDLKKMDGCTDIMELDDLFTDYESMNGDTGMYGIIADIMQKENNIPFSHAKGNCDGEECIMLPEGMPWTMNEIERGLTQEDVDEVCRKYMDELGIKENETTDYLRVEYFG